ncbi:MAG: LysR substrate-binding domain-containing protein, partial [Sphingomonas sp.]
AEADSILRISAPTSFATNWLAGRLGAFQLAKPGLAVRLEVEDRVVDFVRDEADIAIRFARPPWPGVRHEFLMRIAVAPFASPTLLAAHPPVQNAADILALPRLPDEEWWALWQCAAGIADHDAGNTAPFGIRFDSQVLAGSAAINGHGVALLTPVYWQAQIGAGQLVQLWPVAGIWDTCCWLVYPEAKRNQPKIRAFRDWIMAEMKASAASDCHGILEPPRDA